MYSLHSLDCVQYFLLELASPSSASASVPACVHSKLNSIWSMLSKLEYGTWGYYINIINLLWLWPYFQGHSEVEICGKFGTLQLVCAIKQNVFDQSVSNSDIYPLTSQWHPLLVTLTLFSRLQGWNVWKFSMLKQ